MSKLLLRAAFTSALIVFAAGCQQQSDTTSAPAIAPASAGPDVALLASIKLLRAGDFNGLMQNALPPAEFAKVKADWNKDQEPVTDEDRAKFTATMGKLTAPDAETAIYAEIEPQLKQFDAQYQQQIPMYVTMGSSWLQGLVQQSKDMSDASKQQAVAAINTLGAWVTKTRFTDPDKIKQVIAIVVKTARDLNLKTLDEARGLSYEQGMQKAQVAYGALKQAFNVYGFSLDETFDSIKPEVVSNDGKAAKLKVSYTLLGTPLTGETDMVNVDGRWYGKETIERMNEHREEAAAAAPPAPAPDVPPPQAGGKKG